jgi:hypothetical protein
MGYVPLLTDYVSKAQTWPFVPVLKVGPEHGLCGFWAFIGLSGRAMTEITR